jgi:hypothetical protein
MNKNRVIIWIIFLAVILGLLFVFISKPRVEIKPYTSLPVGEITSNWITLSPSGRYFMFENNTDFFPIGVAMEGSAITYDSAFPTKNASNFQSDFETLFSNMNKRGENLLRISVEGLASWDDQKALSSMIDNGKLTFFEDPVGNYNLEYAKKIYFLMDLAEKYDIYLQLDIGPHSCGVPSHFDLYPYHTSNGGPVKNLPEIRTNEIAKELWKNRIKYSVDMFGNSDRIFAWELWNEIDIPSCGKINAKESEEWVDEMGNYLRDYEMSRYGKVHLIGLGAGVQKIPYEFFFNTTGTDILQSHDYSPERGNLNPIANALHINSLVSEFLIKSNKPYFENERSGIGGNKITSSLMSEIEHDQEWAYLASGAAGGGAEWSYPLFDKSYLMDSRNAMRKILSNIPLSAFDSKPWNAISSNKEIIPMVISNKNITLGWLLHNNSVDYDIEAVKNWRDNFNTTNPLDMLSLKKWMEIIKLSEDCKPLDEDYYKNKLLELFTKHLGASAGAYDAQSYFSNPQSYVWFGSYHSLKGKKQKLFVGDVIVLLKEWHGGLDTIENDCNSLSKVYKGHPEVSTTLTINDLAEGSHEITWYDDNTGEVILQEVKEGTTISFDSPLFRKHVAFIVK